MKSHTVEFLNLYDVLEYVGYTHLQDENIFGWVSYGDAEHTLVLLSDVLDSILEHLNWVGADDPTWTNNQLNRLLEKSDELETRFPDILVDMEKYSV